METDGIMKLLSNQKPQANPFSRGGEFLNTTLPDDFTYLVNQERTYLDIGMNKFMEREKPASLYQALQGTDIVNLIERGSLTTDKLGQLSPKNIEQAVNDLVKIADSASVSTSLTAGSRATLTSTLTDNQDANRILLAVFYVTAYQSSIASANAIPNGSSVTGSDYDVYSSHDWGTNNNRYASAIHYVRNASGSTKTVLWDLHWRFIGGTAS